MAAQMSIQLMICWGLILDSQTAINILLAIVALVGGGIFTTNFYFIKMCIDNNKRIGVIETICKAEHGEEIY